MLAKGEQPSAKSYARIDELMREAARRAKGFRLAVENIGGGHVWSGAQAGEFLKRVKEDNVGITWDPNNAAESGEQSFPDGYRKIDPARIFHVHLRDYKHQDGKVVWTAVGRRRVRQPGPDPRAVERRVQRDVHAGDALARSEGQEVLDGDVTRGAVEGDRKGVGPRRANLRRAGMPPPPAPASNRC